MSENRRSWRPRLSVRGLACFMTFLCVLLGCWGATRTQGVNDVSLRINVEDLAGFPSSEPLLAPARRAELWAVQAKLPFVVAAADWDTMYLSGKYLMADSGRRVYYFWCFGYTAKLPYSHRTSRTELSGA